METMFSWLKGHRKITVRVSAVVLLFVLSGYGIQQSVDHFNGIVGMTKKNGTGCYCHSAVSSPSVDVWIDGPDTLLAGETATFTIHVAKESSRTAGFNIASFSGMLGVVDSVGTYWYESELTHAEPRAAAGSDTISWDFLYTAPDAQIDFSDTLYSAGNSTNQDTMATEADLWNFGPDVVLRILGTTHVQSVQTDIPGRFLLRQNYPNPFNPSTSIRFALPDPSQVTLEVFDISGERVFVHQAGSLHAGFHEIALSAGDFRASGVYVYRVIALPMGSGIPASGYGKMVHLK
jgi:hypothetical protein